MSFEIRPARPEEYAAVGRLTADGYSADGLLTRPDGTADDYGDRLADAASRAAGGGLLVATDPDGTLLGTVTWCPPGSAMRELSTRDDQGEFRMLSVAAAARRRGVARALVIECLERARVQQLREVLLCSMDLMTKAHALYTSLGFRRAPELDWKPVPSVQLWAFRLTLDES